MSFKREDLLFDMFYASDTDPSTGDKKVTLTIQLRDAGATTQLLTQLTQVTAKATKVKTYGVGQQTIQNGSDPLLVAVESFYREDPKTVVTAAMDEVLDFIEGNLDAGSTWLGVYGMKIVSGAALSDYLPADVLDEDGTGDTEGV